MIYAGKFIGSPHYPRQCNRAYSISYNDPRKDTRKCTSDTQPHRTLSHIAARAASGLSFFALIATAIVSPAHAGSGHDYELNGSYTDAKGGPSLSPDGGILGATGYTFALNQGLNLSNALDSSNYSIDLLFSVNSIIASDQHNGYVKLIDFKNLSSDSGLYIQDGFLNYYDGGVKAQSISQVFSPNTSAEVLFTRNTAGLVTGSVNGVQQFSFTDTDESAIFSTPGNLIRFFEDDNRTGQTEDSGGFVDRITIDSAPVPETSSFVSLGLMLALGLGGGTVARRKRNTAQ